VQKTRQGGKAIGVGTIIKFLAGTEMVGGEKRKRKSREKKCFYTKFSPRGDMEKR
jgi:hypothetical protein